MKGLRQVLIYIKMRLIRGFSMHKMLNRKEDMLQILQDPRKLIQKTTRNIIIMAITYGISIDLTKILQSIQLKI